MRKVAIFSLGALALFLILKLDWPWLIPVVTVCIFLLRFLVPEEGNVNKRLVTWAAAFVGVALTFVWLIGGFLYSVEEGRYAAIPPGDFFEFFFGTDLLKGFWAVILGVALAAMLFIDILVPYAYQVAKNRYGDYEQYKGNERLAARTALGGILGISQGTWMVKSGKHEVVQKPSGSLARFGGPGILIVQEGHAVILERSGRVTRIVHSGITWLGAFERVSMVVPLQARVEHVVVEKVATCDKVMIDEIEFWVFHKVDKGLKELAQTNDRQFAYNKDILLEKVWSPSGGDWRIAVKSIGERAVRDVVGRYNLSELIPLSDQARVEFSERLARAIDSICTDALGVKILVVDVGRIRPNPQAEEKLLGQWMADWDRHVDTTRAETDHLVSLARATARMQAIQAISRGLEQLKGSRATPEDLIALQYIEYLEHRAKTAVVASEDEASTLIKLQGLETLRSLRMGQNGGSQGASISPDG